MSVIWSQKVDYVTLLDIDDVIGRFMAMADSERLNVG